MPTRLESAASIGDKDNNEDDVVATKKRKGLDVLEIDVFPSDIVVDHDGRGEMELSQVSGMTSSPARMGDNTSAGPGAGSGSVAEDTATAALARTGNNKSVDTMLAASVAAAAEGAEETSAAVATPVRLIKPVGKTGAFWSYYELYHPNHHPEKQNLAHCTLCQTDISIKGRSTTGLTKHLRYKHREEYESMNDNKADGSHTSVAYIFP